MEEKQAFKKGDKIVCVQSHGSTLLKVGQNYTVDFVNTNTLSVEEHDGCDFYLSRFELAKEEVFEFQVGDIIGSGVSKGTVIKSNTELCSIDVDFSLSNGKSIINDFFLIERPAKEEKILLTRKKIEKAIFDNIFQVSCDGANRILKDLGFEE